MEVIDLSFHRYTLEPVAQPNRLSDARPRKGALLRVRFQGLPHAGHADLFPWTELGDEPLEDQLDALRKGVPYSLGAASLCWAHHEAKALREGKALLGETPVASHATLTGPSPLPADCNRAKLKVGAPEVGRWSETEAFLRSHAGVRWRLDFNGLFRDLEGARKFWRGVSPDVRERIEFVEDPMAGALMEDAALKEVFRGTKVAVDRAATPRAVARADLWVVKPVCFSPDHLFSHVRHFPREVVVTSNMDHPLGQLIALHAAQELRGCLGERLLDGGLITHGLYAPHAHSHWVEVRGACLRATSRGPGWGLGEVWERLTWEGA